MPVLSGIFWSMYSRHTQTGLRAWLSRVLTVCLRWRRSISKLHWARFRHLAAEIRRRRFLRGSLMNIRRIVYIAGFVLGCWLLIAAVYGMMKVLIYIFRNDSTL